MTIPESLIVSPYPFPNPKNDTERNANERAEVLYNDPEARENGANVSGLMFSPENNGDVYFVAMGWTADGWRVFATLFSDRQFIEYSNTVRDFSFRYQDDMKARLMGEFGITPGATLAESIDQIVNKLRERPDCGDPECPIHHADPEELKQRLLAGVMAAAIDDAMGSDEEPGVSLGFLGGLL